MKSQKWIYLWFYLSSSLIVIAIFNYIVDPYQQFRKASFYKLPYENGRELNAGLAKNYTFDSVIIGTSMMENFNLEDTKRFLHYKEPIKLTIPGCSIYEQSIILNRALKHQKIKNIFIGIDFLSYYGAINRFKHGESFFPTYLYDDKILNKHKYLFSKDTLERSLQLLFSNKKDSWLYDYSKMYEWRSKTDNKNVLKQIYKRWMEPEKFDNEASHNEKKENFLIDNYRYNLEPLIQKNPEVLFSILFPPYSVLAHKIYLKRGELHGFMSFKSYLIQSALKYDNIKIYDFQNVDVIIFDLNNYYDLYHYNKRINRWMLEQIDLDRYRVTKETSLNYQGFIQKISDFEVDDKLFKIP